MSLRQSGFSLLEVVLSAAVTGIIVLGFSVSQVQMIEWSSAASDEKDSRQNVQEVLKEIELAIQMSETIEKSGDGVLALTTRYLLDTTDDVEFIVYELDDDELTVQVDGGPVETLLVGVQSFQASSLEIEDSFLAADYDTVLTEGDDRSADPEVKAKYKVLELGDVDPYLADAYMAANENVELISPFASLLVTVSPPLPRDNLAAKVKWVPMAANKRYWPIVYGDYDEGVAVTFRPTSILVSRYIWDTNVGTAITTPYAFKVGQEYEIGIQILDGYALFWMDEGDGPESIGKVSLATLDDLPICFGGKRNSHSTFDDLRVWNPLVEFRLTVDLSGVGEGPTETFSRKVALRQP